MRSPTRRGRVLFVADNVDGGLGAAVAGGSQWLAHRGWDLTVAAPVSAGSVDLAVPSVDVPIPDSARQLGAARRAARRVEGLIADLRPDVVHVHGLRSFLVTRLLARQPALVTLHAPGASPSDPAGYHLLRRAGFALVPRLAAAAFTAAPGMGSGWTFLAHASPRLAALERLPFPQGPPVVAWIGRLDVPKRPDVFAEAVALAAPLVPGLSAVMAGTGPLEESLRAIVRRTGAPIELLGHVDDVTSLLAAASAVVLISGSEAVTFAVQEAMWAGRPVIVSDLPGHRWLLGAVAPLADDAAAVAAAIVRIAGDPSAAELEGAHNAARIRDLLDPAAPWPAVEACYGRLMTPQTGSRKTTGLRRK